MNLTWLLTFGEQMQRQLSVTPAMLKNASRMSDNPWEINWGVLIVVCRSHLSAGS